MVVLLRAELVQLTGLNIVIQVDVARKFHVRRHLDTGRHPGFAQVVQFREAAHELRCSHPTRGVQHKDDIGHSGSDIFCAGLQAGQRPLPQSLHPISHDAFGTFQQQVHAWQVLRKAVVASLNEVRH